MIILGDLLRSYRKERDLSIRDLAVEIGVDHAVLWRFETGKHKGITFGNLCRIIAWSLSEKKQ